MHRLPFFLLAMFCLPMLAAGADIVLVLPFFNQSESGNLRWIGESIAEHTRESLDSEGLLVLSREDRLEAYRRLGIRPDARLTRASIIKVGQALDAAVVVYGYFEVTAAEADTKASLRITARILDLKRTRPGPEFTSSGPLEDLASLEMHLAWQSLQVIVPNAARTEAEFRRDRPPVRVDAIENYIRGLLAASPEQQHRFFTQAARIDNRFSQPCFQLGRMAWRQKDYAQAAGWLERVTRTDSHYLEAAFLLGLCRYNTGEFAKAEESFQIVAAAAPLNEVFNNLGAAESRLNQAAALENFKKALDGDDTDPDYQFNLGYALWKRGDFSAAAERFRAVLDRQPEDSEAVTWLGRCLKREGPRAADTRSLGRERLKPNFEVAAYRQLKAELEAKP
jgi:tetratricopeptide (TPR) repeat protein